MKSAEHNFASTNFAYFPASVALALVIAVVKMTFCKCWVYKPNLSTTLSIAHIFACTIDKSSFHEMDTYPAIDFKLSFKKIE